MKIKLLCIGLSFGFLSLLRAQSVPVELASWLNDAKGAYSIIHDDYGDVGVDGIWQYADTIAFNRGLKFTFGAISSSCEAIRNINGEVSPYAYAKNVMMAQHNHEIINHTHTHTCAVNQGWSPCNSIGWGQVKDGPEWNKELHTSHTSILTNTGFQPRYFIYPYDQFTDLANTELASMGYLGSRTGWSISGIHSTFYKYGYETNDENLFKCDANGFFRTSVQVFDDADATKSINAQTSELNSVVDDAIAKNEWGNRELHNVGFSGWGHVNLTAYRDHLNYVQSKVQSGDLWMPTMSEMLTYQIQKLVYTPSANYNSTSKRITVSYTENHSEVSADVGSYLAPLTIKSPVTIVLDVAAYTGLIDFSKALVKQGATTLSDVVFKNNKLYVNTYPSEGSFTIEDAVSNGTFDAIANEFLIYPNPTNNRIYVNGNYSKISLFSSTGSKLLETTAKSIDISNFSRGVYFIQINDFPLLKRFVKL